MAYRPGLKKILVQQGLDEEEIREKMWMFDRELSSILQDREDLDGVKMLMSNYFGLKRESEYDEYMNEVLFG